MFTDEDLKRLKATVCDIEDLWRDRITSDPSSAPFKLRALLARLKAMEGMSEYIAHVPECILNQWQAGEPTEDGGYKTMYAGKWYQSKPVDEMPKCDCGLDQKYEVWRKAAGRV